MGATVTVAAAATGTSSGTIDARGYDRVILSAPGLAGAENVVLTLGGGSAWSAFTMPDGTTNAQLTAANQSLELPGGLYKMNKSATAASVALQATLIGQG